VHGVEQVEGECVVRVHMVEHVGLGELAHELVLAQLVQPAVLQDVRQPLDHFQHQEPVFELRVELVDQHLVFGLSQFLQVLVPVVAALGVQFVRLLFPESAHELQEGKVFECFVLESPELVLL